MRPVDVITRFEQLNMDNQVDRSAHEACVDLAGWLAEHWAELREEDTVRLVEIGTVLWREAFEQQVAHARCI